MTTKERLWRRIIPEPNSGCWIWAGREFCGGYGRIMIRGKPLLAHRAVYAVFVGGVGKSCVLHKCDNRSCVNPAHLFLGSRSDNHKDMVAKGRQASGFSLPHTKISMEGFSLILSMRRLGKAQAEIAKFFNVDQSAISVAFKRKKMKWKIRETQV